MNIRPTVFPLNSDPQGPTGQTSEQQLSARYKNMLGFQAAGQDIGLFYQLERSAEAVEEMEKVGDYDKGTGRQFDNIKRYGNYANPIEAGGVYT